MDLLARQIGRQAQAQFLGKLESRPPPSKTSEGAARYGPNYDAVDSFLANLEDMTTFQWQEAIGGVLSLLYGPNHPAKERMRALKAEASYTAGQAGRKLQLDDHIALAQDDVAQLLKTISEQSPFVWACENLGIDSSKAIGPVEREASSVVMGLVLGPDNLGSPVFAALSSAFVEQVLGEERYENTKRDFREALGELDP